MNKKRCPWVKNDPLEISYHDKEWGVPQFDDRLLFEFLILEGMQAGLSWFTILKKREAFRTAFSNFDARKIAKYDQHQIALLLKNPAIIRNKSKISSVVKNAQAFIEAKKEWKTFSNYIWHFVDKHPIQNNWKNVKQVPRTTAISDAMSKDLKKRGFSFVGSAICYAFMQAVGMANDHTTDCFRHKAIKKMSS